MLRFAGLSPRELGRQLRIERLLLFERVLDGGLGVGECGIRLLHRAYPGEAAGYQFPLPPRMVEAIGPIRIRGLGVVRVDRTARKNVRTAHERERT